MTTQSQRETAERIIAAMAGLDALSPNHADFIRWRREAIDDLKAAFDDDTARIFYDIPFYEYKKVMGFFAKQYSPEAYRNGLARSREFLEKKARG